MAKIVGFFVCLLIIALDIGAGICGIEAEMAADKVKHLKLWIFECRDPSNEAFKFGVAAAGLMALAHIIANLFGVCFCFFSNSDHHKASPNRQLTTACLILSCLASVTSDRCRCEGRTQRTDYTSLWRIHVGDGDTIK
ncbi:protein DESIGUAL 2-like isoform X2 [Silene latifolia]|uniref:protein DESIGUAL 2-like isoform X2 n=1 Tax=Silene latifolia TaxID=37657 RepID=UPI003D785546